MLSHHTARPRLPGLAAGYAQRVRRPSSSWLLVLAAGLAATGCGGLSRDELERGIGSLEATAVEGRILALGAAQDRTKATFTRVHARDLAEQAQHEAEKLADASPDAGLDGTRDRAVALAGRIADALSALQTRPGAEDGALEVRDRLQQAADEAARLVAAR